MTDTNGIKGNLGDYNSGNRNSGDCNSGNYNSGNCNSGDYNSGNRNIGNCNSGDYNSGNRNSGDYNSGDWNSGDYNSGDYNSGDWNKTSFSNGCFNTELPKIYLFNKSSDWTYEKWLISDARRYLNQIPTDGTEWVRESDMTDGEREANPEYTTTGGFLKAHVLTNQKRRQDWWDGLSDYGKEAIMSIPNFDARIFEEITGIKVDIGRED